MHNVSHRWFEFTDRKNFWSSNPTCHHEAASYLMSIYQVAVVAICWINRLIIPMMQGAGSERIKEDDEVILELDMSSVGAAVAKPKRRAATPATVAHILIFSMFMICGIGALATALCAQIMAISDAERVWGNLSHSSGAKRNAQTNFFLSTKFQNLTLISNLCRWFSGGQHSNCSEAQSVSFQFYSILECHPCRI